MGKTLKVIKVVSYHFKYFLSIKQLYLPINIFFK